MSGKKSLLYLIAFFAKVAKLIQKVSRFAVTKIEFLTYMFIDKYRPGSDISLSSKVIRSLKNYNRLGNIRELEDVVKRKSDDPNRVKYDVFKTEYDKYPILDFLVMHTL